MKHTHAHTHNRGAGGAHQSQATGLTVELVGRAGADHVDGGDERVASMVEGFQKISERGDENRMLM